MEVNEGRLRRSEGHFGSVKVGCESVWLLHFSAARRSIWPWQLDNSTADLDSALPFFALVLLVFPPLLALVFLVFPPLLALVFLVFAALLAPFFALVLLVFAAFFALVFLVFPALFAPVLLAFPSPGDHIDHLLRLMHPI